MNTTEKNDIINTADTIENSHLCNTQVIGFLSGKGGVGKTGLAINIANFCSENGTKVLLIDCDISTNGATMFFCIDEQINKKVQNINDVLDFQEILSNLLNEIELGVDKDASRTSPILIKDNFYFVPAGVEGNVFDEQELNDEVLFRLEKELEQYFLEWRKEYDLIILDFGAGEGRINSLLSKIADNICIVMHPDEISRQAVRKKLNFLFREHSLDEIMCCINMTQSNYKDNVGVLINEFIGFENSSTYSSLYEQGKMIEISESDLCKKLSSIVNSICREKKPVAEYERKIQEKKHKLAEERKLEIEEAEHRLEYKKSIMRLVVAVAIAVVSFVSVFVLVMFKVKLMTWYFVLAIVALMLIEWLIIGRGKMYKIFVEKIQDIIDAIMFW